MNTIMWESEIIYKYRHLTSNKCQQNWNKCEILWCGKSCAIMRIYKKNAIFKSCGIFVTIMCTEFQFLINVNVVAINI